MKVIILAAGLGTRLGRRELPKPLTPLCDGTSIMQRQLHLIERHVSLHDVIVVVGYRFSAIIETFPDLLYVYNSLYERENTAKSLLRALRKFSGEDVLWLNGDVVFSSEVLDSLPVFRHAINCAPSAMLVTKGAVDFEGVKYRCDGSGRFIEVSKSVQHAEGEALGVNFFRASDVQLLIEGLEQCLEGDYFERGIEHAIAAGLAVWPVVVSSDECVEVDFLGDLDLANQIVAQKPWH